MEELNRFVADNLAAVIVAMAAVLLVLLVLAIVQMLRVSRATRAYRELVRGGGAGGTLHEVIEANLARMDEVAGRVERLHQLYDGVEARSRGSLQHIGLVRFNPFEDTGSDQSFAIALLDDRRDGIVLSSLHGRANTRVFAKPVENGTSRHNLSAEESEAIRIAVSGTGPLPGTG